MLETMPAGKLDYWIAYDRIEGVGPLRLIQLLTKGLGALMGKGVDPLKNVKYWKLDRWLSEPKKKRRQTMEEQMAVARSITHGGR